MPYPYPGLFAIDPKDPTQVAMESEVTIFDLSDRARAPISLTDLEGFPIENPLVTTDKGFVGAFLAEFDEVGWYAAGMQGTVQSFQGVKNEVLAASERAILASNSASAASEAAAEAQKMAERAAELVDAPPDTVVADLVRGNGATAAALYDHYTERGELGLSVAQFGAVGDGDSDTPTDDTVAIKNALAAVAFSRSGSIHFEKKTYYMNHAAVMQSNTTIYGHGAKLLKRFPTDQTGVFFGTKSYGALGYGSGGENITVRDLTFEGAFPISDTTGRRACAFGLHHAKNVLVENCRFVQMNGSGHSFDLNGCDGVTIKKCMFIGWHPAGTSYMASECIQLDQSKASSLSFPEDLGQLPYDGILTKNVHVDGCYFLPTTVEGVTYPAPNPMGSHTVREGQWYENIWFTNNTIVDPQEDTTSKFSNSQYNGNIHLIGVRGVRIKDNTWISTTGGTVVRCISLYGETKGNPIGQDPNITQSVTTIPAQSPEDIWITGNRFVGFDGTALADNSPIYLKGVTESYIKGALVKDNVFRANGSNTTTIVSNIFAQYVENLDISGNHADGCRRHLEIRSCKDVTIHGEHTKNLSNYVVYADQCDSISVSNVKGRGYFRGIRIGTSRVVHVESSTLEGSTTNAPDVWLIDCTAFWVEKNFAKSTVASPHMIRVEGASSGGFVNRNIAQGHVAVDSVTATGVAPIDSTGNLLLPA